jgi:phospholipase/carboxylesterase
MSETGDDIVDAITQLLPRLLGMMDRLALIGRHMHPPRLAELVGWLREDDQDLSRARDRFRAAAWPEGMAPFRDQLDLVASHVLRATEGLRVAMASGSPQIGAYRAMRHATRAIEALYPVTAVLPTVSQYFLEPGFRDDAALLARLRAPVADTGVMHADNETGTRGGFSVYVPEYYDPGRAWPLIMALHGGAGHGRLFLWSWVAEARSRGAILIAPTAMGETWSLMDPAVDIAHFGRILDGVGARWNVDPGRMLLTGMSDGGTFTLLAGLDEDSRFTHLAPVAASFHPLLLTMTEPRRIQDLPILLTHGALDWMFPVGVGRTANRALTAAGARVTYREIEDLSHAYPRDRNPEIMDWFLAI